MHRQIIKSVTDRLLPVNVSLYEQHLNLFFILFSFFTVIFAGIESYLAFSINNLFGGSLVLFGVIATLVNLLLYLLKKISINISMSILLLIFFGFYFSILTTGVYNKLSIYWVGFFCFVTAVSSLSIKSGIIYLLNYFHIIVKFYFMAFTYSTNSIWIKYIGC